MDKAGAVQQLLLEWMTTAERGDRAAFGATLIDGDPSVTARGDSWFANLRTLGGTLRLSALTSDAVPGIGLRTRHQDRAWLQQIRASWQPPGTKRIADATLWFTVVAENGRARFAGDSDAPAADRELARPLWLQDAISLARRGAVTVVATAPTATGRWLDRAVAAATAVRRRLPRWDGGLTVELPATRTAFERCIVTGSGSLTQLAAVAWPRGERADEAAVTVVVNPVVTTALDEEALAVLLTHETVHVATRSFASAAPTWLIEGYADHLAYAIRPASRVAAGRPLSAAPPPTRVPTEADFGAEADRELAYARAWSLCDLIADRYGAAALDQLYGVVGAGTSLAAGLRTLGITEAGLIRDWRTFLRRGR